MATYVVINSFGEFVQNGRHVVTEYPDATIFTSRTAAVRVVREIKKTHIATWYLVENYGLENESRIRLG